MTTVVRVWDLPTRVFHWALVTCIVGLVTTAQFGGSAMDWHFRFGYGVLSLLLFRLVWGLIGGYWSRFRQFMYTPSELMSYLKGTAQQDAPGHSPLGALSVFAILGLLLFQVSSGLMSDDEISAVGPLAKFVSTTLVGKATFYHKEIGKVLLLALIVLHIGAIVFYLRRRHVNLLRPMIAGDRELTSAAVSSRDDTATRITALLIWLCCLALVLGMVKLMA